VSLSPGGLGEPGRADVPGHQDGAGGGSGQFAHYRRPHQGASPVHLIIAMIKWIRTSRFSIKNSLSPPPGERERERERWRDRVRDLSCHQHDGGEMDCLCLTLTRSRFLCSGRFVMQVVSPRCLRCQPESSLWLDVRAQGEAAWPCMRAVAQVVKAVTLYSH